MGKKILLLTPPPPPVGSSPMHYGDKRPPLGLGFLAAYIKQFGHEARIIDNLLEEHDIEKEIGEFKPDFIGIYVNTTSFLMSLCFIEKIRGLCSAPIICGGPHVSVMPESLEEYADYLVVGEGEAALKDILDGHVSEKIVRKGYIEDLNTLPWPDYSYFADKPYNWELGLYGLDIKPVFTMNTSRGCPLRCQFCAISSIWGKRYRLFSAKRIVEEIENLRMKFGAKGIYFREDNFTAHAGRIKSFCRLLKERRVNIKWACETRADLSDSLIYEMAEAGCGGFYVGLESGSQRVLDLMKKEITLDEVRRFFKASRKAGITTYATMCYGTPGETKEDRDLTEDLLQEVSPDVIDRFAYLGVPTSPYYEYLKKSGNYYHIDEAGFIYTDIFKELVFQLYPKRDPRVQFLMAQEKLLEKERMTQ